MAFHQFKKSKRWIIKALDHNTKRTIAWIIGNRDAATVKRLYDKLKHIENCIFYTDNCSAFSEVLPKAVHIVF